MDVLSRPPNRPFVTVSYAQTLDGRLATRTGSSQWISGSESLRFAHELRANHDAIMVGVGTVLQDNPRLTVRLAQGRDPLRVVVDARLETPPSAAVLANGAADGTILVATDHADDAKRQALEALGTTVLDVPGEASGRVNLVALFTALRERDVSSIMVEGGARLITSLLRARLVDRLAVCIAPKILGLGVEAVGDLGISDLAHALRLENTVVTQYGVDLVIDGRVIYPEAE